MTPDSRPRLPRHVRLQFEPVRQAWALLSPEKVMWPDQISLDILKRCDGATATADIVAALAKDYQADVDEVSGDVIEFLQTWADMRLVAA
jgi:pyrroloquinoline quinone biosynthesis protein D